LDILAGNYEEKDKKSVCVWLQKAMSTFLKGLPDLYFLVTAETRTIFKKRVFEILAAEPNLVVKKNLADTIGEIAGSLLSDDETINKLKGEKVWPEYVSSKFLQKIHCHQLSANSLPILHIQPRRNLSAEICP
jgi:hypothetical protein